MPEIEILRVLKNPGDPVTFDVETASRDAIVDDDPAFGLEAMVEVGDEHGVTRWAEATPADIEAFDKVSFVADQLVLVGWAEAPISRDDVEVHADMSDPHPAVNVKVQNSDLPKGQEWTDLVDEFELDSRLAALPAGELRDVVDAFLGKDGPGYIFGMVCEDRYEETAERAKLEFFKDYEIDTWTEGRSGGWFVVGGLPPVEHWGVKLLTQWHLFSMFCAGQVADVPRGMAWHVLANCQDELAGRVVRVEVTMVLSDADLAEAGDDPGQWDWKGMLDLGVDSTVTARKLP